MRDDRPDGWFRAFACRVSDAVGSHWAFFTALGIVLVWGITGPIFREHLSTLDVLDLGDGTSLVVYAADADPATMALVIAGAAGNALEHLRDLMEGPV